MVSGQGFRIIGTCATPTIAQTRTVLFPIRLDNAVMETDEAWAADIRRTRHIGDFSEWKNHDSYQKGFARLLRDLKAEDKADKKESV